MMGSNIALKTAYTLRRERFPAQRAFWFTCQPFVQTSPAKNMPVTASRRDETRRQTERAHARMSTTFSIVLLPHCCVYAHRRCSRASRRYTFEPALVLAHRVQSPC